MAGGRAWAWLVFSLVLGIARSACADANAASAQSIDDGIESFHEKRLPNGLRVVVGVDHHAPLVALRLGYAVGDVLDPPEHPGVAQIVATLLPDLPTRHLRGPGRKELIEAAGFHPWKVTSGAATEWTGIELQVPAAALELALYIEAERMGFAADGVDFDRFRNAARHVHEAHTSRNAVRATNNVLERAAYGAEHPFARQEIMGGAKPLAVVDLRERIRRYYNPASAMLVLVGDLEPQATLDLVARWFGALPGLPVPSATLPAPRAATTQELEVRASDVKDGAGMAWTSPEFLSDDDITLDVIARYLSRRLLLRLGEHKSRISVRQSSLRGQSVFYVHGPLHGVDSAERWRELVLEEIHKLTSGEVDDAMLRNARDSISCDIATNAVSLLGRAGYTRSFVNLRGTPDFLAAYLGGYRATDAARAAATAQRVLGGAPRVFLRLVHDAKAKRLAELDPLPRPTYAPPVAPGKHAPPDSPLWYRPPLAGAVHTPAAPQVVDATLARGTRVLSIWRDGPPAASVRLQVAWQAAPPSETLWPLLRDLLGTSTLEPGKPSSKGKLPLTLFRALSPFAKYEASADSDELDVRVDVVPERVDEVLDRLGQALQLRKFSPEYFTEGQKRTLDDARWSLRERSWRRAGQLLNPAEHRYWRSGAKEARERVQNLKLKDLEQYWAAAVRPEALRFAVIGPVEAAPVRAHVERIVAALPRPAARAATTKPKAASGPAHGVHVFTSEVESETDLLVLWPVPAPGQAGHPGAHLLRWVFGGTVFDTLAAAKIGVKDDACNTWHQRDQNVMYCALRVQPEQAVAALDAVFHAAEAVAKNDFSWVVFVDARREATQWITGQLSGAEGLNGLAGRTLSLGHSVPTFTALYDAAWSYERAALPRDAARLDRKLATVIVNGRFTRTPGELEALGVGEVTIERDEGGAS